MLGVDVSVNDLGARVKIRNPTTGTEADVSEAAFSTVWQGKGWVDGRKGFGDNSGSPSPDSVESEPSEPTEPTGSTSAKKKK